MIPYEICCQHLSTRVDLAHCFWDKSGQRGSRGTNTQNDNFLNLSLLGVMFFHWIPLRYSRLEYGNRFIAAFTVAVIWMDQQSCLEYGNICIAAFTVAVIWKTQQSCLEYGNRFIAAFTVAVISKDQQSCLECGNRFIAAFTVAVI